MGKTLTFILILICAVTLPGCNGEAPQEGVPDADLVGALWTLQSIEVPGEPDILPESDKIFNIQFFKDHRFAGLDNCNAYGGIYALAEDSEIRLDSIVTTLVSCAPPHLGHPYYQTLHIIDSYEIRGNTLRLQFDIGSALKYRYME